MFGNWGRISGGTARAGSYADTTIGKQRDRAVKWPNRLSISAIRHSSETPLPRSPGCRENRGESCPGSRSGGNYGSNSESNLGSGLEGSWENCPICRLASCPDRSWESCWESRGENRPGSCPENCSPNCSGDCSEDCSEDCPENCPESSSVEVPSNVVEIAERCLVVTLLSPARHCGTWHRRSRQRPAPAH